MKAENLKSTVVGCLERGIESPDPADVERAEKLAKAMALVCVRNTILEDFHAGSGPLSRTGDYSDVVVVDGDGRVIPWMNASRLDNDEMRAFMRQVVDRLFTFLVICDDPASRNLIDTWHRQVRKWDDPRFDESLVPIVYSCRE